MPTKKKAKNESLCWKISTFVFATLAVIGFGGLAAVCLLTPKEKDNSEAVFNELNSIVNPKGEFEVTIYKKGTTDDGKYFYEFVSWSHPGYDGAWGSDVYFRKTTKGSTWMSYTVAADSPLSYPKCSELTGDLADFIKNYDKLDDDLDQIWVTCAE